MGAGQLSVKEFQLKNSRSAPFPLINAVIEGHQEGTIFSLDEIKLENFFVLHKAAFSFLFTKHSYDFIQLMDFIKKDKSLPDYFHIYDPPEKMLKICGEKENFLNFRIRKRIQLKYIHNSISIPLLPADYECRQIDAENFAKTDVFGLEIDKKFWSSREDFLQKGFGFLITDKSGRPASICYAACVTKGTAEIDVATLSEFRQMGFAKTAVAAFVSHCLAIGLTANWDCFEENIGSLKTATGLGFTRILQYPFLSIYNKTK